MDFPNFMKSALDPAMWHGWSDSFNPVLVKEIRQLTRNRLLLAIIWLGLFGLAFSVSGSLLLHSMDQGGAEAVGFSAFIILIQILGMALAGRSLDALFRTVAERSADSDRLLYATLLSPSRILRGKFWAEISVNLLILSLGLPFLTLSYMLRGLSLPVLFLGVVYLLALALLLVPLAQVLALLPVPSLLKRYGGGFCLVVGVGLLDFMVAKSLETFSSFGSLGWQWFWMGILLLFGMQAILTSLSRFLLSRASSDRSWRPRLFILAVAMAWLAGLTVAAIIFSSSPLSIYGHFGAAEQFVFVASIGVVVVHLLPILAVMLALQCPAIAAVKWRNPNRLPAWLGFPFMEGTLNGLVMALLLAGVAAASAQVLLFFLIQSFDILPLFIYWVVAPVVFGYLFCYGMTARLVGDWMVGRGRTSFDPESVFAFLLMLAGVFSVVARGLNPQSSWVFFGNVFDLCWPSQWRSHNLCWHGATVLVWGIPLLYWSRRAFSRIRAPAAAASGTQSHFRVLWGRFSGWWRSRTAQPADPPSPHQPRRWRKWLAGIMPILLKEVRLPIFLPKRLAESNPVLLKETCQMGHSRFPGIVLMLEIGALVLMTLIALAGIMGSDFYLYDSFASTGLLSLPSIVIMASAVMSIDLMNRTAREHDPNSADLLFITTLTPGQIVLGKFGATLLAILFLYVIAIPFLVFLFLLIAICFSGLNTVGLMVFGFVGLLALACLLPAWALVMALLPLPEIMKRYLFTPLLGTLGAGMIYGLTRILRLAATDSLDRNWGYDLAGGLLALAILLVALLAIACFLASPPVAPRSRPLRMALLKIAIAWYFFCIPFVMLGQRHEGRSGVLVWALTMQHLLPLVALLAALQCPRTIATFPPSARPGWRGVNWLFLEGTANGFCFSGMLVLLAAGSALLWGKSSGAVAWIDVARIYTNTRWETGYDFNLVLTSIDAASYAAAVAIGFGYLVCYALTARLLGDRLRVRGEENPLFAPPFIMFAGLGLAGIGTVVTGLILSNQETMVQDWRLPGNVFACFWASQRHEFIGFHAAVIASWLGICLWFARHWRMTTVRV
jgi:hypothetical protein